MAPLKQAVSWWCFVPALMSPQALIQAAVDLGYSAIELVGQEHWQAITDAGLQIASINGHSPIEDGLNRLENRDRITRELEANLELAVKWGIPNLICFSGNRGGLSDEEGLANTVENLQSVATMAEDAGVTLILELLNSKVDHPDYMCDHTAWGAEVIKQVASARVRLLYDIYHMQIMEGDLIRNIQDYAPQIGHYHTAGNPGRHEIDATQEINYPAVVRAILATGYAGYLGQEFIPVGDPRATLKQAFDLCHIT